MCLTLLRFGQIDFGSGRFRRRPGSRRRGCTLTPRFVAVRRFPTCRRSHRGKHTGHLHREEQQHQGNEELKRKLRVHVGSEGSKVESNRKKDATPSTPLSYLRIVRLNISDDIEAFLQVSRRAFPLIASCKVAEISPPPSDEGFTRLIWRKGLAAAGVVQFVTKRRTT